MNGHQSTELTDTAFKRWKARQPILEQVKRIDKVIEDKQRHGHRVVDTTNYYPWWSENSDVKSSESTMLRDEARALRERVESPLRLLAYPEYQPPTHSRPRVIPLTTKIEETKVTGEIISLSQAKISGGIVGCFRGKTQCEIKTFLPRRHD